LRPRRTKTARSHRQLPLNSSSEANQNFVKDVKEYGLSTALDIIVLKIKIIRGQRLMLKFCTKLLKKGAKAMIRENQILIVKISGLPF